MEEIGFIGLGTMGRPMAERLVAAGFPVTVHNRSRPALDALQDKGATVARSVKEVTERSEIVITMLPDSPDVEDVVLGDDGLLAFARAGTLVVDMSTVAPSTARRVASQCAEHDVGAVDAPVSGGEAAAIDGQLSIMAGGSDDDVRRAQPIFDELGKSTVHIGEAGAGQIAKAANQAIVATTIQAVAEALTLARKAGVDPAKVRQALLGGFAQSRVLDVHGQRMLERDFKPGFRVELHCKDLSIALQTGAETRTPLLVTAQVAQLMNGLDAIGHGSEDHSALYLLQEQVANL